MKQTLKDFEERRVPIDVCVSIFYRTSGVSLLIWAQQDFYWTLGAGQMDGQTLKRKKIPLSVRIRILIELHLITWVERLNEMIKTTCPWSSLVAKWFKYMPNDHNISSLSPAGDICFYFKWYRSQTIKGASLRASHKTMALVGLALVQLWHYWQSKTVHCLSSSVVSNKRIHGWNRCCDHTRQCDILKSTSKLYDDLMIKKAPDD